MKVDQSSSIEWTRPRGAFLVVLVSICVLTSIIVFSDSLLELVRRWSTQEEYGHGFLIPLIVAWLLWARRDGLIASLGCAAWSGGVVLLLAAIIHVLGKLI